MRRALVRITTLFFTVALTMGTITAADLQTGQQAPPLHLEKLLQAPPDTVANWEVLRGKVVVLEFWATWCAPCVQSIPHLNALAERFRDKPVQFISITSENERIVQNFLKKTPIHSWIGLDLYHTMNSSYGVDGIPMTVVINKDGIIADITHPIHLSAEKLERILAGTIEPNANRKSLNTNRIDAAGSVAVNLQQPLFEISIRPSLPRLPGQGFGIWSISRERGEFKGESASVEDAIKTIYGIGRERTIIETDIPKGNFDFIVRVPESHPELLEPIFEQALFATFNLRLRKITEETDVYILSANGNLRAKGLKPTNAERSFGSHGNGQLDSGRTEMDGLAKSLATLLNRPVLNETKLGGAYEVHLKWEMNERELAPNRLIQISRAVAMAIGDKNFDHAQLTDTEKSILRAIQGETSGTDVKNLPPETKRLCQILREELAKPENDQFRPDPQEVIRAVQEQLGLDLKPAKRPLAKVKVEKAESNSIHEAKNTQQDQY